MLVYVCNALPYPETLNTHWVLRILVLNVASQAFPCSMGVTYRRPHEPQYTYNSEALNTYWELRIACFSSIRPGGLWTVPAQS